MLDKAVGEFAKLPGIGRRTALRLVLHLLKQDEAVVEGFCGHILQMKTDVQFCHRCHNIADDRICNICKNGSRRPQQICVVESIREVIAIETTQQFNGLYHVLGGIISPLDGVGPDQLTIDHLVQRVKEEGVEELIFALNPTIQGDTTIYYIQKKLQDLPVKVTTIARGVAFGGELEYADEMTLGRSLQNRLPVDRYVK